MSASAKPPGKAMYVAPQSDKGWLWNVQRTLHTRSSENLDYVFEKLWGFITDPRNLRIALARVSSNRGKRTAGVDGLTVGKLLQQGIETFTTHTRDELRSGTYRPQPVRRVLIPKQGQPGKHRALGIPTVKDRVVQAAVKNIIEPIYEADFYPTSYGFRPNRSAHQALEHLRRLLRPRKRRGQTEERELKYQWAIEGDIKACFDNIDHHALMQRLRRRIGDTKVTRLVVAFLKAGILSEEQVTRSDSGTPQGGILSPLLANIALEVIEERYAEHVWPRRAKIRQRKIASVATIEKRARRARERDRAAGRTIVIPIRYADDFILLFGADDEAQAKSDALTEKERLATYLKERMGLELSEQKTLVTKVTEPMKFLGHHVRVRKHPRHRRWVSTAVIPKERSQKIRDRISELFDSRTVVKSLADRLRLLNPILRGWSNFYRHAWGAKKVFDFIDTHVWWTIFRWLKKKHRRVQVARLLKQYGFRRPGRASIHWKDGTHVLFRASTVHVGPYELPRRTAFAIHHGEPGA